MAIAADAGILQVFEQIVQPGGSGLASGLAQLDPDHQTQASNFGNEWMALCQVVQPSL